MILTEIQYDLPQAFIFVFLNILFVILFWILSRHQNKAINRYTGSYRLFSLIEPSFSLRWIKYALICVVWLFSIIAFMQPKGNPTYLDAEENAKQLEGQLKFQKNHQVTFLIDASLSMSIQDSYSKKSRLEYSKELVDEIISNLQGEMVSLGQFSDQFISLAPPTLDYLFVRMMLQGIEVHESNGLGTDLSDALRQVLEIYSKEPAGLLKTLVILSDGGSENASGSDLKALQQQIANYLNESKDMHLSILTIGVGSKEGGEIPHFTYEGKPVHTSLQPELLQLIAEKGNGEYISAQGSPALYLAKRVSSIINNRTRGAKDLQTDSVLSPNKELHYDYYFQIPLGLSLLCLCWVLTLPESLREKRGNNV